MKQLIVAYSLFLASFSSLAQSQKISGTIVPQKNKSSQLFLPNNSDKTNTGNSEKGKSKDSYAEYGPPPVNDNSSSSYPSSSSNDQSAASSSNQYTLPNSTNSNANLKAQQLKGVLVPEKNKSSHLLSPSNADKSMPKEKLPAYEPPPVENNAPYGNIDPAQREQKITASGNYTLPSANTTNNSNLKGQHLKGALVPKKNQAYTLQPGKSSEADKEEVKAEVEEAPKVAPPANKPVPIMSAPASYADATKIVEKSTPTPALPTSTNNSKPPTSASVIEKNNRTYTAIKKNTPPPPANNNVMLVPILKSTPKATNTPTSPATANNTMTVAVSQNSSGGNKRNVFKSSGNHPVIIEIVPGATGSSEANNSSSAKVIRNAVSNNNVGTNAFNSNKTGSSKSVNNNASLTVASSNKMNNGGQKNDSRSKIVTQANNNGINTAKNTNSHIAPHQNNVVVAPAKNASSSYHSDHVRHRFIFKSNGEFNVVLYAPLFTLTLSQYGKIIDYQVSDASGVAVTKNYRGLVEFIGPVYLQYDYDARLRQIANTIILYNYHGYIEKVGQTVVTYNYNKSVYSIGGNRVEYNANGTPLTEQIQIP